MERTVDEQAGQCEPGVVRSCPVDSAATSFLRALDRPRFVWADGSTTIMAGGTAATITADGPDRFESVRNQSQTLFATLKQPESVPDPARPRLYGGFSFTDTHRDPDAGSTWEGYPGAWFTLPAIQVVTTPSGSWLTTAATGSNAATTAEKRLESWRNRTVAPQRVSQSPGITAQSSVPPRSVWQQEIKEATAKIEQGKLRKVVLAQALTATLSKPVDVCNVLARLGESYPECFRFLFEPETGGAFFGATPERLVSVSGTSVETEALAGSIGRGETGDEDEWLARQLLESEKNSHEHEIVVETICEQLKPLTTSVNTDTRRVRKLSNVQHLQTPIHATISEPRHVLEFVEALHPTPAVGGLPPEEALQTIRETEGFDRGWYAAPVGWIDGDGNGTFAVAIRSAIAREQTATLFAGAGIVADSDPDEEYDELQLKYQPILDELT